MAEMNEFTQGVVKSILEKYVDPIIKGVIKISQEEWDKFKVDFGKMFEKYIHNSKDKYCKIKTLLYRTEPKNIYDFFEVPFLKKKNEIIKGSNDEILNISNFLIIQGTGGIGKSTFMKYLFLKEIEKRDYIPVFIELKDLNKLENCYSINEIILEKIGALGGKLNESCLEYSLKSGCFLFFLDGYDELLLEKKDDFFKKFDSFCDKYTKNKYIMTSRPCGDSYFIEFQRFTVLDMCLLTKDQATNLIKKIEYDKDIKERFLIELEESLYEKHTSFAANPLLLNIMLMTFDNYAEIPDKIHLFYEKAFETLYSKHDATKSGFRRELKSSLPYDLFKKVFAKFCFISYINGKLEFSNSEIELLLQKIKVNQVEFQIKDYIDDLIDSICVLCHEGFNIKFVHRSFQEYFSAIFLSELSDEEMKEMGLKLIYKDVDKAKNDEVFKMLYDMQQDKFEQNILLPLLEKEEKKYQGDKYDFYFDELVRIVSFEYPSYYEDDVKEEDDVLSLMWTHTIFYENDISDFIKKFHAMYVEKNNINLYDINEYKAEFLILKYFEENIENIATISGQELKTNDGIYDIFKGTWIGKNIMHISTWSALLIEKNTEKKNELSNLFF